MALPNPTPTTTAVVTGASSGIGADIARELAARGHGVTLVARREDRLRSLAEELGSKVRVEVIACDVADPEQRGRLLETIAERGLTMDILVNNAGIGTVNAVAHSPVDAEVAQVRVNVEAVIDLTTRAVQQMVPRHRGAILNVGSGSGFFPFPGQSGYGATKAFVNNYTEAVRAELKGFGIAVTVLVPGPVHTEFFDSSGLSTEEYSKSMPKITYMPSREVARIAIDALDKDQGMVIPGLPTKIMLRVARLLPHRVLLPLLASANPGLQRTR